MYIQGHETEILKRIKQVLVCVVGKERCSTLRCTLTGSLGLNYYYLDLD